MPGQILYAGARGTRVCGRSPMRQTYWAHDLFLPDVCVVGNTPWARVPWSARLRSSLSVPQPRMSSETSARDEVLEDGDNKVVCFRQLVACELFSEVVLRLLMSGKFSWFGQRAKRSFRERIQ